MFLIMQKYGLETNVLSTMKTSLSLSLMTLQILVPLLTIGPLAQMCNIKSNIVSLYKLFIAAGLHSSHHHC